MKTQTVNKLKVLSWIIGFLIFVYNFKMVLADDNEGDDDNGLFVVELIRISVEILIGFGIETCSQNPSCNYYMRWFVCTFIFITIICIVLCGYRPKIRGRDLQSSLNVYVGMRLARK